MTDNAQLNGNNGADGEGSYLEWDITSQNVAGNYSTIHWEAGWRFNANSCRGLRLGQAKVNGTTVYNDTDGGDGVHAYNGGHDHGAELATASGNINVTHNPDGTKSCQFFIKMTGWEGQLSSATQNWNLTTIPRLNSAPGTPVISSITSNSVHVAFTDGTGGATPDGREIAYGPNSAGPTASGNLTISSDGSTDIFAMSSGTTYYFWARMHNAAGFSPWSARAQATTHRIPDAPSTPVITGVTQNSLIATWTPNFDGGSPITGYDVWWGTSPSLPPPNSASTAVPNKTITGLLPGTQYYVYARSFNTYGPSGWSGVASTYTVAGARVKDGGVWKNAVPYVRDGGVWKLAKPLVRVLGVWKDTT